MKRKITTKNHHMSHRQMRERARHRRFWFSVILATVLCIVGRFVAHELMYKAAELVAAAMVNWQLFENLGG